MSKNIIKKLKTLEECIVNLGSLSGVLNSAVTSGPDVDITGIMTLFEILKDEARKAFEAFEELKREL